jgi:hypothetical protein
MQALQPGSSPEDTPKAAASNIKGVGYYAGLVTTDLQVDNNASGADMLKRSLQLAGKLSLTCMQCQVARKRMLHQHVSISVSHCMYKCLGIVVLL